MLEILKARHWTEKQFSLDPARTYDQKKGGYHFKPDGLWVEFEGDWKRWCDGESFATEQVIAYDIELATTGLLILSDVAAIDRVTAMYRDPERYGLDWTRMAQDYKGICITPYQWHRRMSEHARWYYSWDCASGCIWDLSAIVTIVNAEAPCLNF